MTGEMSKADVTRDAYPYHFAAADLFDGATVEPFDTYQGPYVLIPGKGKFWLVNEDGNDFRAQWYDERADTLSEAFPCYGDPDAPLAAFREFLETGGTPNPNR